MPLKQYFIALVISCIVLCAIANDSPHDWKTDPIQDIYRDIINTMDPAITKHINVERQTVAQREIDGRKDYFLIDKDALTTASKTIKQLYKIIENYNGPGTPTQEMHALIETALETPALQTAFEGLARNNIQLGGGRKKIMDQLWLNRQMIKKSKEINAFEHVYLDDRRNQKAPDLRPNPQTPSVKARELTGIHNAIYMSTNEGDFNDGKSFQYLQTSATTVETQNAKFGIADIRIQNTGRLVEPEIPRVVGTKSSTIFVGTSPEVELALTTVSALMHPNQEVPVYLDGENIAFYIQTHLRESRADNSMYLTTAHPLLPPCVE